MSERNKEETKAPQETHEAVSGNKTRQTLWKPRILTFRQQRRCKSSMANKKQPHKKRQGSKWPPRSITIRRPQTQLSSLENQELPRKQTSSWRPRILNIHKSQRRKRAGKPKRLSVAAVPNDGTTLSLPQPIDAQSTIARLRQRLAQQEADENSSGYFDVPKEITITNIRDEGEDETSPYLQNDPVEEDANDEQQQLQHQQPQHQLFLEGCGEEQAQPGADIAKNMPHDEKVGTKHSTNDEDETKISSPLPNNDQDSSINDTARHQQQLSSSSEDSEHEEAPQTTAAVAAEEGANSLSRGVIMDPQVRLLEHASLTAGSPVVDECALTKRGLKSARSSDSEPKQTRRQGSLEFGYFTGETIFRNAIHPDEKLEDGHVSMTNLVLPECSSALVTTFEPPNPFWVDNLFPTSLKRLIVIRPPPGSEDSDDQTNLIGRATLHPMFPYKRRRRHRPGWRFLYCKPHTGGCLHGKVFLFRSDEGLRVVVSGNNFYQQQVEHDRDCFWVQDFPAEKEDTTVDGKNPSNSNVEFGTRLREFLGAMCECEKARDEDVIRNLLATLFERVNLSVANARLVYSFPRPKDSTEDKGGWTQLASVVQDLLIDYNTDESPRHHEKGHYSIVSSPLYAMSGSMGDLKPDFLHQMVCAFQGRMHLGQIDSVTWEDIENVRCLMPSSKAIFPIVNGRLMSYSHWKSIPENARRRIFWEGVPNPPAPVDPNKTPNQPFSHCKVLYQAQVEKRDNTKDKKTTAILYVGSHNFSRTAWGLRGEMPRNTEIGVVLSTTNEALKQQWEDRLPYILPSSDSAVSQASYVPATSGNYEAASRAEQKQPTDPNPLAASVAKSYRGKHSPERKGHHPRTTTKTNRTSAFKVDSLFVSRHRKDPHMHIPSSSDSVFEFDTHEASWCGSPRKRSIRLPSNKQSKKKTRQKLRMSRQQRSLRPY